MFTPGSNIAIKAPRARYDDLVGFYRDTLGLEVVEANSVTTAFAFGAMTLWVDRVDTMTQPEVWLEVRADDIDEAAQLLHEQGVTRCDEVEPLPPGFEGFWIAAPGGLVHLVSAADE